jgi:hypothetical protein
MVQIEANGRKAYWYWQITGSAAEAPARNVLHCAHSPKSPPPLPVGGVASLLQTAAAQAVHEAKMTSQLWQPSSQAGTSLVQTTQSDEPSFHWQPKKSASALHSSSV